MAMILALVLGASHGLLKVIRAGALARLERYEGYVMGGIFVALGLVAAWV